MTDREKVIKGWECHMEADTLGCADCPYRQGWRTCNFADTLFNDVYALLKEQEAVAPRRIDGKRNHFIKCGNCNYDLLTGYMFCPRCGKAVKWE